MPHPSLSRLNRALSVGVCSILQFPAALPQAFDEFAPLALRESERFCKHRAAEGALAHAQTQTGAAPWNREHVSTAENASTFASRRRVAGGIITVTLVTSHEL